MTLSFVTGKIAEKLDIVQEGAGAGESVETNGCVRSLAVRDRAKISPKFDGLVLHYKANHISRIVLYKCPLMKKEECLYSHESAEMVVRHALRSHCEQYDDREMKKACTTLHMVIRRNSKYVNPVFLELLRDPETGKKTDLSLGTLPVNKEGYVTKRCGKCSQPPGPNPTSIRESPIPSSIALERSATTTQREVGAAS